MDQKQCNDVVEKMQVTFYHEEHVQGMLSASPTPNQKTSQKKNNCNFFSPTCIQQAE